MINFTKKNVLVITLTITVLIYGVISVILLMFNEREAAANNTQEEIVEIQDTKESIEPKKSKIGIWEIQIPSINLTANIAEGTTSNIIANYVGHFVKTSTLNGNIGLAAHNRGVGVESYFKDIKKLKIGDEIIYKKDEDIKKYEVTENIVIDETDWTYLQNTDDNRITLITCVENKPAYRRCVQAIEVG